MTIHYRSAFIIFHDAKYSGYFVVISCDALDAIQYVYTCAWRGSRELVYGYSMTYCVYLQYSQTVMRLYIEYPSWNWIVITIYKRNIPLYLLVGGWWWCTERCCCCCFSSDRVCINIASYVYEDFWKSFLKCLFGLFSVFFISFLHEISQGGKEFVTCIVEMRWYYLWEISV